MWQNDVIDILKSFDFILPNNVRMSSPPFLQMTSAYHQLMTHWRHMTQVRFLLAEGRFMWLYLPKVKLSWACKGRDMTKMVKKHYFEIFWAILSLQVHTSHPGKFLMVIFGFYAKKMNRKPCQYHQLFRIDTFCGKSNGYTVAGYLGLLDKE